MLHSRHTIVTILTVCLALHGCKKDRETPANEGAAAGETSATNTAERPAEENSASQTADDSPEDEQPVTNVEQASAEEPEEPAGPVIEPFLVQGRSYERTVDFRSKRETRVERGDQSIFGTTFVDWSVTYQLTARDRTSKRDYLVDVRILDVSATRDSEPWVNHDLPDEGSRFRCRLRQRAMSCEGMSRSVEDFAGHWLFGTWGDFVPSHVVRAGERWQRRGPYGVRFGIEGDEPTTLAFEVTSIEELGRDQFRVQHDLQLESDVFWPTPGGQRRADISGSGEAEFDSMLGLFSRIELGWDGMLVHEGRVGPTPFRFTRREETRVRIDTSPFSGRAGATAPNRQPADSPVPRPLEGQPVTGQTGSPTPPPEPSSDSEPPADDAVGTRPY